MPIQLMKNLYPVFLFRSHFSLQKDAFNHFGLLYPLGMY